VPLPASAQSLLTINLPQQQTGFSSLVRLMPWQAGQDHQRRRVRSLHVSECTHLSIGSKQGLSFVQPMMGARAQPLLGRLKLANRLVFGGAGGTTSGSATGASALAASTGTALAASGATGRASTAFSVGTTGVA
jgi:hypothetical protein